MAIFDKNRALQQKLKATGGANQITQQQANLFGQTVPIYQQAMQFFLDRARGMASPAAPMGANPGRMNAMQQRATGPAQGPGMMSAPGVNQGQPFVGMGSRRTLQGANPVAAQPPAGAPRVGGVNNAQMGVYGQGEDALRMAAAEDDIMRFQRGQEQRLKHNLAQRGLLDSGMYAAGSTQLAEDALRQMADYRRNLAINAGNEQANRYQQLLAATSPGLGMGPAAMQGFGQQWQQSEAQRQNALQLMQGLGGVAGMALPYLFPQLAPGAIKR